MDSDTELEVFGEALDYYNRISHSPLCVSDGASSTSSLEGNINDVPGIIIMYDRETEENRHDNPILQECDRCDIIFSDIQEVEEHSSSKKKTLNSSKMLPQITEPLKALLYQGDEIDLSTKNGENSELGDNNCDGLADAWSGNQHQDDERKLADLRVDECKKDRFQSKRSGDEECEGTQMDAADDCKQSSAEPRNDDEAMAVDRGRERESSNGSADGSKTQEQLYFASRRVAKRASRGCAALHCIALHCAALYWIASYCIALLGTFDAKSSSLLLVPYLHLACCTSSLLAFLLYSGC